MGSKVIHFPMTKKTNQFKSNVAHPTEKNTSHLLSFSHTDPQSCALKPDHVWASLRQSWSMVCKQAWIEPHDRYVYTTGRKSNSQSSKDFSGKASKRQPVFQLWQFAWTLNSFFPVMKMTSRKAQGTKSWERLGANTMSVGGHQGSCSTNPHYSHHSKMRA